MSDLGPFVLKTRSENDRGNSVQDALHTIRTHLGMDIAYLSEFVGDQVVFRAVDTGKTGPALKAGDVRGQNASHCHHIARGALPNVIEDTTQSPLADEVSRRSGLEIGSVISVPIERSDGSIFGMFGCFSHGPTPSLNARDLQLMRVFSRLAQAEVQRDLHDATRDRDAAAQIEKIMSDRLYHILYQPIVDLQTNATVGFEALCRFDMEPYRPPNLWFDDAARLGLGELLELSVIAAAVSELPAIPAPLFLSVNASPATAATGGLSAILFSAPPDRVVVELTEHEAISDWDGLHHEIVELRGQGIRVAVDDAGSGYAGLQQLVRIHPDTIKMDRSLISGIDGNSVLRSLCASMVHFTNETGARLLAEGIETKGELTTLQALGVRYGQGYHIGRPAPLEEAVNRAMDANRSVAPELTGAG